MEVEKKEIPSELAALQLHVIHAMLKDGIIVPHIVKTLYSLYLYYNIRTDESVLEKEVLAWHEFYLEEGEYNKKGRNIKQDVENLIDFRGAGIISLGDFYADLKIEGKEEKAAVRMALSRFVDSGKIEKIDAGRTGTYRLVQRNAEKTKFIKKEEREGRRFSIALPFGLSKMCNIHPKSIIIIAGSKSAGKTSILLNIAKMNERQHEVDYLNSDMGNEEWTDRLLNMGYACEEDVYFNSFNRSSDFQDLITPERKIFIIDFLEIHDDFYKIGSQIKQIWDKLRDGVAIIGLQMKQGATLGRGGDFTKEKARLYLSLDYVESLKCTKIRIEEAKSPAPAFSEGIRGWWRHVKIVKGGSEFRTVDHMPLDETGWTGYEDDNEKKKTFVPRVV